ncbi:hypothetical protein [Thiosulfativibrio zosterae]|uniref:Lipoprotein n=1 Tax=Thiosulfativibrio zosterae TaxID=2675053 RepID=A0A6F8PK48_9GAMM|nr:hypothetical protein [Thiosulfativibrio zosterae]BBP42448.1 hypothetical protein THMIRHAT_01940 [Thiosulfativibrio zosterae]
MRLLGVLPLAAIVFLQGCDLGIEDKKTSAPVAQVTSTELKALFESFILIQDQEMMLTNLATQLQGVDTVSSVAGLLTNTSSTGVCGGTSALSADLTAVSGDFDNTLTLNSYCTDSLDWTGKLTQSGVVTATGSDADNYEMVYGNYIYKVESDDAFTVTLVGTMEKAVTATATTHYFNRISAYKYPDNLTVEALKWLVATYDAGKIYTGSLVHPTYGTVAVTTVPSFPVTTTQDGPYQKPISGKLKLTGLDSIGYITFNGLGSYTLDVDADADGIVDLTETLSW